MATIDEDVVAATGVLNGLVTKVGELEAQIAGLTNPPPAVSAADQSALEAATAAGQAALTPPAPVPSALTVPDQTLNFALGQPASFQVADSGGTPPVTVSVDTLPSGLTLDATGTITGTPDATGTTSVAVTATDATGATATGTYTITVA